MTVYKYFIKIALRNKWAILSYTIIFFIIAALNGSSTSQREANFVETKLNVGIIDNSKSELSGELKKYLIKKNNIVEVGSDESSIKEEIFLGIADAVIVIPEDFEERVINKEKAVEVYRDDRKMESVQIQTQLNKFFVFINATYENGRFNLSDVNTALDEKTTVNLMKDGGKVKDQGAVQWFRYYYNFTSYVIIGIYIMVMGLVMNDFMNENVDSRRKISSKRFLRFNEEIYLGQLSLAGLITLIFILGSIVLRGKYIGEVNFGMYVANLVVFSFTILCLTFLINNVVKNKFAISAISTVLSLGTSFISGVMVPQQLLGKNVLTVAKFFPTYYYVRINDMQANSFSDVRYEIFMQLLFAAAFLLMGLYFSKAAQKA
ncbi:ABC transporter permease [Acidilutibacter cellobiosedens]|uniref:ABC transporter permease n=1 Tax=Acidilutibacter cellobiosedens TaxID=2507161 RepID=A0A410QCX6_9FIRM|nr:ABC transporter permease [Acidilutibacter cellobiosedens]QAT61902.1 ABC transporter permease [Acidilutibacter cellobiosedens]